MDIQKLLLGEPRLGPRHRIADVNQRSTRRRTPAGLAAAVGTAASLRLIVTRGGDINAVNDAGNNALLEALLGEGTDLDAKVALLLSLPQMDVDAVNGVGVTALDVARERHLDAAVAALEAKVIWQVATRRGQGPAVPRVTPRRHSIGESLAFVHCAELGVVVAVEDVV